MPFDNIPRLFSQSICRKIISTPLLTCALQMYIYDLNINENGFRIFLSFHFDFLWGIFHQTKLSLTNYAKEAIKRIMYKQ